MYSLCTWVRDFWRDEKGVTSIEYVLIASLIVVVIVVSVNTLGGRVNDRFLGVAEALCSASNSTCN